MITDYDVRFIVRNDSVGSNLSISIIRYPHLHDLFRLILIHGHTSVCCLILPLFPCLCQSVVEHNLACLFMYYYYHYYYYYHHHFIIIYHQCRRRAFYYLVWLLINYTQMTKTTIRYADPMAIIIYEPLPLISLCVLFRKAVTTGFAIINCRFKALGRRTVDFIGYCLPRLASRSSFWTKLELSFKSGIKACLSASGKGWWTSLCWLWRVQCETQIPQLISRTLSLNGAHSLSWPSDWLSWLVSRLACPAWQKMPDIPTNYASTISYSVFFFTAVIKSTPGQPMQQNVHPTVHTHNLN